MLEGIFDGVFDTLKLLPYLFITFVLLEMLEHKMSKKNQSILLNNKKYGPIVGGLLGGLPQCGFSTMAANLFSSRVITMGTLIAVFLATSDEMIPIMIGEKVEFLFVLKIISFKVIVGIIIGVVVDMLFLKKDNLVVNHIHEVCDNDHCNCNNDGILKSSIKHTIKIGFFILFANLLINIIIFYVGEDNLSYLLLSKSVVTYFLSSLFGMIPNCASSVIITELYLSKLITLGGMLSGLLSGSGIGILLLFRTNKNLKENIFILSIIYFVGVVLGMIVDMVV